MDNPDQVLSTILKHDAKQNTYKIALLRAINDVVLNFPDLIQGGRDVAIPLKMLARYWVAYYWPFVDPDQPIYQGQRSRKHKDSSELKNDMEFRDELTALRREWQRFIDNSSRSSDGFFLINDLRIPRKAETYPSSLYDAYTNALKAISKALKMPIQHSGQGTVFDKTTKLSNLGDSVVTIPGTEGSETCLVISNKLWNTFIKMSLWVEALCIHEWCLFTERITEMDRGYIYRLLTDRPDNRISLSWERNKIDILLAEGKEFICPWTEKKIRQGIKYDLDHLLPISLYPINELWNIAPADPDFNSHKKRDRLPTIEKLQQAHPYLICTYENYSHSESLWKALQEDVAVRFANVSNGGYAHLLADAVVKLINIVAESRNIERFK
jgi:hypothetical protein